MHAVLCLDRVNSAPGPGDVGVGETPIEAAFEAALDEADTLLIENRQPDDWPCETLRNVQMGVATGAEIEAAIDRAWRELRPDLRDAFLLLLKVEATMVAMASEQDLERLRAWYRRESIREIRAAEQTNVVRSASRASGRERRTRRTRAAPPRGSPTRSSGRGEPGDDDEPPDVDDPPRIVEVAA